MNPKERQRSDALTVTNTAKEVSLLPSPTEIRGYFTGKPATLEQKLIALSQTDPVTFERELRNALRNGVEIAVAALSKPERKGEPKFSTVANRLARLDDSRDSSGDKDHRRVREVVHSLIASGTESNQKLVQDFCSASSTHYVAHILEYVDRFWCSTDRIVEYLFNCSFQVTLYSKQVKSSDHLSPAESDATDELDRAKQEFELILEAIAVRADLTQHDQEHISLYFDEIILCYQRRYDRRHLEEALSLVEGSSEYSEKILDLLQQEPEDLRHGSASFAPTPDEQALFALDAMSFDDYLQQQTALSTLAHENFPIPSSTELVRADQPHSPLLTDPANQPYFQDRLHTIISDYGSKHFTFADREIAPTIVMEYFRRASLLPNVTTPAELIENTRRLLRERDDVLHQAKLDLSLLFKPENVENKREYFGQSPNYHESLGFEVKPLRELNTLLYGAPNTILDVSEFSFLHSEITQRQEILQRLAIYIALMTLGYQIPPAVLAELEISPAGIRPSQISHELYAAYENTKRTLATAETQAQVVRGYVLREMSLVYCQYLEELGSSDKAQALQKRIVDGSIGPLFVSFNALEPLTQIIDSYANTAELTERLSNHLNQVLAEADFPSHVCEVTLRILAGFFFADISNIPIFARRLNFEPSRGRTQELQNFAKKFPMSGSLEIIQALDATRLLTKEEILNLPRPHLWMSGTTFTVDGQEYLVPSELDLRTMDIVLKTQPKSNSTIENIRLESVVRKAIEAWTEFYKRSSRYPTLIEELKSQTQSLLQKIQENQSAAKLQGLEKLQKPWVGRITSAIARMSQYTEHLDFWRERAQALSDNKLNDVELRSLYSVLPPATGTSLNRRDYILRSKTEISTVLQIVQLAYAPELFRRQPILQEDDVHEQVTVLEELLSLMANFVNNHPRVFPDKKITSLEAFSSVVLSEEMAVENQLIASGTKGDKTLQLRLTTVKKMLACLQFVRTNLNVQVFGVHFDEDLNLTFSQLREALHFRIKTARALYDFSTQERNLEKYRQERNRYDQATIIRELQKKIAEKESQLQALETRVEEKDGSIVEVLKNLGLAIEV